MCNSLPWMSTNEVKKYVSRIHNQESTKVVRIKKSGLHQHRGRSHLFWLSLCFRATALHRLWFRPNVQTEKSIYNINQTTTQHNYPNIVHYSNIIIQMLHNIIIQNIQILTLKKIQSTPYNYTRTTATTSTTTSATTFATPATLSSSPTTVNLPIIHLSQYLLQMLSFLRPSRHQTAGHHNIHMVFDAAQPSAKL